METENEQEEVVVNTQEEITTEEATEESQEEDVLTLTGDDKAEYEKYKAKKEQRKQFAEKAESNPKKFEVTPNKLERIELRQDGYSKEEVDAIMELGGIKMINNPVVKSAIEQMRAKEKSENASQSLSSKSPVYKKYTQEDMSKMTSKELEAILPKD